MLSILVFFFSLICLMSYHLSITQLCFQYLFRTIFIILQVQYLYLKQYHVVLQLREQQYLKFQLQIECLQLQQDGQYREYHHFSFSDQYALQQRSCMLQQRYLKIYCSQKRDVSFQKIILKIYQIVKGLLYIMKELILQNNDSKLNYRIDMDSQQEPIDNVNLNDSRKHQKIKTKTSRERIMEKFKKALQLKKTNPTFQQQLQKIHQKLHTKPKRKYTRKPQTQKSQKQPCIARQKKKSSKRLEGKTINYLQYFTECKSKNVKHTQLTTNSISDEKELLLRETSAKQQDKTDKEQQQNFNQQQQLPCLYQSMLMKQKKIDQYLSFNRSIRGTKTVELNNLYEFLDRSGMHCDDKVFNFLTEINPNLYKRQKDFNMSLTLIYTINVSVEDIQLRLSETKKLMRKSPTAMTSYQQLN